jgi:redox-sensitive bicupin YhaK (pirin superfamily)
MGTLAAQDELTLSKLNGEHAILYLLDGSGFLKGYGLVEGKTLYAFTPDAAKTTLKVKEETSILYLTAQPIGEKVEQYGPYVMNSQTEILEALRDYQMGKMGFLVEEFE